MVLLDNQLLWLTTDSAQESVMLAQEHLSLPAMVNPKALDMAHLVSNIGSNLILPRYIFLVICLQQHFRVQDPQKQTPPAPEQQPTPA